MMRRVLHVVTAALALAAVTAAAGDDTIAEHLALRPLPGGKVLAAFTFNASAAFADEGSGARAYGAFPRALGEVLHASRTRELQLAVTQGSWDARRWGGLDYAAPPGAHVWAWFRAGGDTDDQWKALVNALSGLLCASLNFIDATRSAAPELAFRRVGAYSPAARLDLRYGALPRESACTENLTPWMKFLPCLNKAGLSTLLNSYKVFDTDFSSMGIHVYPECANDECSKGRIFLTQHFSAVLDPNRKAPLTEFSLSSLFNRNLARTCFLSGETTVEIDGLDSAAQVEVVAASDRSLVKQKSKTRFELGKGLANFDIKVSNINAGALKSTSELQVHRYQSGHNIENGGIVTQIHNLAGGSRKKIAVFEMVPWFVRVYLSSLRIVNDQVGELKPTNLHFQQSQDRGRPTVIEFELALPATAGNATRSTTTVSYEFEKAFLRYTEYPPDANRGFDICSSVISLLEDDGTTLTERYYTEPILVPLPTPDFSMPYNVITLTCTVIALFFGSMMNLLVRDYEVLVLIEKKGKK